MSVRTLDEITRDREAAATRKTAIGEETRAITTRLNAESRTADPGEQERLARLDRGFQKAAAEEDRLREEAREALRAHVETHPECLEPTYGPLPGDAPTRRDGDDGRPPQARAERDAGRRAIDALERSKQLPTDAAERAERLLGTGTPREQSIASRWAATTGDPAYNRAFMALLADPQRGHLLWTPQEADAYRRVEEMRAYGSLTDNVGGFMVPAHLDPAIILSNAGTTNAMRRVATVKQTVSESWNGVTSVGTTAEWKVENAQAAEATPILAAVPIPVYMSSAFTPFSYEVGMDAVDFQQELVRVLVDALDRLQASAYTVGTGSMPTGVVVALTGGASEINGTGGETIIAADPMSLQTALPARFSANAAFMAHIGIINLLAQLETTAGSLRFPEIANGRLLNKPLYENSDMDGVINAAATENNYCLVYGDFREYYVVDRIGTSLEIISNLMGANYRPTGSRGAYLWARTGGNVSTINAFRLLDVPTTA
jgi:HK97 family phage major capsid protein